jgi:hypothetical protein
MRSVILKAFAISFFIISCKENVQEKEPVVTQEIKEEPFTVTVNGVVDKDDTFQIFYNEEGTDVFAPEDAVTINIKGSSAPQDMVFALPSGVEPQVIRFDIGANDQLKKVKINSFTLSYADKSFTVKGKEMDKYFITNSQIKFDAANSEANITTNGTDPYDPLFVSTPALKEQIMNLYKE